MPQASRKAPDEVEVLRDYARARIRRWLVEHNKLQKDFAAEAELSESRLTQILKKQSEPSIEALSAIFGVFGLSIRDAIDEAHRWAEREAIQESSAMLAAIRSIESEGATVSPRVRAVALDALRDEGDRTTEQWRQHLRGTMLAESKWRLDRRLDDTRAARRSARRGTGRGKARKKGESE